MKVETFEVEEVNEMSIPEKEECLSLINELGLSGQQKLINTDKSTSFAYRKATMEEKMVYEILLPSKCNVESFGESQMPIRVLQVLYHAKSLDFFTSFHVSYPENADVKDPVLWGHKQIGNHSWEIEVYILARWGEVLIPFAELRKIAADKLRAIAIDKINVFKNEIDLLRSKYETCSVDTLLGNIDRSLSLYI